MITSVWGPFIPVEEDYSHREATRLHIQRRICRPVSVGTPGRNDPCPCNSGRKYKKCCGQ